MPSFLKKIFLRVRHKHGFGIHSPFAYRFITEVLNLPGNYGYYSYLYISERYLRTIFRIAVHFNPQNVCVESCRPEVRKALTLAAPHATDTDMATADIIVFDASRQRTLPASAIPASAIVIILNHTRWKNRKSYMEAMKHGMTFSNASSMCVAVPLPHLPRQDFDVAF